MTRQIRSIASAAAACAATVLFVVPTAHAQNAWRLETWLVPPAAGGVVTTPDAISPNGIAAAGKTRIELGGQVVDAIWVWTEAGGFETAQKTPLDPTTPPYSFAVTAVSDTGVVVGYDGGATSNMAWKWTVAGGVQQLADMPNGNGDTVASGVSADGSVILGEAYDTNPNFGVYDEEVYALSEDEKTRRSVVWRNGSPSGLSPYYDSTRRTPYKFTTGFEELPWKRVLDAYAADYASSMDGAGSIVVGSLVEYVGSAHPDWDNGGAQNVAAGYVSPPGAAENSDGPFDAAGSSFWQTVSSDGRTRAGIEIVRASTSAQPSAINILWSMNGAGPATVLSLDAVLAGSFWEVWSVSSDGAWMILGSQTPGYQNMLWNRGYGLVEFNDWIQQDTCLPDAAGLFFFPYRIVADGPIIMGYAATPAGPAVFRLQPETGDDTDGDGLLDTWELNGLDINNDGVIDLDLPAMGADPYRKDLFVEVDAMRNVPWTTASIDMVIEAFAKAPVPNFDEFGVPAADGITLHVDYSTVETVQRTRTIDDRFIQFQALKADHFGTPGERSDPNWPAIKCAREAVFRYCLIVDEIADPDGKTTNGLGETPGDDFMVSGTTGATSGDPDRYFAITFMHELGHNLNLKHGGDEEVLFKPNYVSVMNYSFREAFDVNASTGEPKIDYSREDIADINESAINEKAGVPSSLYRDILMPYGWQPGPVPDSDAVQLNGSEHDFDHNGDVDGFPVAVDLNWRGDGATAFNDPSPGKTLTGHDDWAAVRLPLGVGGGFARDASLPPAEPEITTDVLAALAASTPPPPTPCVTDINADGVTDGADLGLLLGAWGSEGADLNGDGVTDGADLGLLLGAWGACP
jgi:hypothetical protein